MGLNHRGALAPHFGSHLLAMAFDVEKLACDHPNLATSYGFGEAGEKMRWQAVPMDVPVGSQMPQEAASRAFRPVLPNALIEGAQGIHGAAPVSAAPGDLAHLDPQRDTLANIDALGRPVPSARFMGGREFSQLTDGVPPAVDPAVIDRVLAEPILLLPSVTAGCGPFPQRQAEWRPAAAEGDAAVRYAAVSFYLALMTAECLVLTGAAGTSVVEGPFAANPLYCAMLEAATGRPVEAEGSSATGTSIGAALLARMAPQAERPAAPEVSAGLDPDRLRAYAARWRESIRS